MTGERQVEPAHYWSRDYNSKGRFCSLWHQLDEVIELGARTVLEVGPGSGLVTDWLTRAGVEVTTCDIDPDLGPSVVGSLTDLPLPDDAFDAVLCCEVLEHLLPGEVPAALSEIARVARAAVISVPDVTPWAGAAYPLYFGPHVQRVRDRLPESRLALVRELLAGRIRLRDFAFARLVPAEAGLGGRTWEPRLPIPHRPWPHEFDGEHHWELGTEGHPAKWLRDRLRAAGLEPLREFRVPENPWHHFFVVRRAGSRPAPDAAGAGR